MNATPSASSGPTAPATGRPRGVVVGFDGSPHAVAALEWAAHAAEQRHVGLTVVSAYRAPAYVSGYPELGPMGSDGAEEAATSTLGHAKQHLESLRFTGNATYLTINDDAAGALVRISAEADLIVAGRRGVGRFWSRMLGSVSSVLPAHTDCPTVVVSSPQETERGVGDPYHRPVTHGDRSSLRGTTDSRPVTVGVDGSEMSRRALLVAAEEAQRADVPLQLVLAIPGLGQVPTPRVRLEPDPDVHPDTPAHRALVAELAWLKERHPEADAHGYLVSGAPAEAMITLSGRSQLTVLGSRGRGGFASLLLGSVSRTTLSHARGTIMVVPAARN